jgi:hypothetical protein
MTLLPGLAAAVLLVWALGGELTRVASLRFSRLMLLYCALGAQVVAFGPVRILAERQVEGVQIVTYALLLVFCLLNRRVPGFWLITLGVAGNALVITANGGAMPVDPNAIHASGWSAADYAAAYPNVVARAHAPLWFLGDVFAMPRFPGSAVLSIGDLAIIAGACLLLQHIARLRSHAARCPIGRREAAGGFAAAGLPLAGLLLIDVRAALLVAAIGAGALLGVITLAFGQRPPAVRCLSICSLLALAGLLLAGSTGTLPTAMLGAIVAGLALAIGLATASSLFVRAAGGDLSGGR